MSALLPTYARSELSFARGEGAYLYTTTGERYLDFASGVAVTALGIPVYAWLRSRKA